jgi:RNA polymerase sigma-70 factor (ECF subfamily)
MSSAVWPEEYPSATPAHLAEPVVIETRQETRDTWADLNASTDEDLASLFLAGQHDALAVLFDRYSRLTYSIAVRIVKDECEAEDIVQTVFLDSSRAMGNFNPKRGSLKVWLLQYAYHRALHRKRHLMANQFYSWVELEDAHPESYTQPVSEALERSQLLHKLLEQTTMQRRSILELTYCEGLTANEVSIRLGLSVNIVRHELYRALTELRKLSAPSNVLKIAVPTPGFIRKSEPHAQSI